jgi:glutathione S-transferase
MNQSTSRPTVADGQFTVYHIEERRSERVIWLLEELGLPYTIAFKPGDLMASLQIARQGHSMGMVPVFKDRDTVVIESGAILEYIIGRYGNGRFAVPASSPDYPRYLQWLHFAEGSAAARIIQEFLLRSVIPEGTEPSFLVARNLDGTKRVMQVIEQALANQTYFAGREFTAADIMMEMPLQLANRWGVNFEKYPNARRWHDTVRQRPAYKRAVAAGSPNGPLPEVAMINRKLLADA